MNRFASHRTQNAYKRTQFASPLTSSDWRGMMWLDPINHGLTESRPRKRISYRVPEEIERKILEELEAAERVKQEAKAYTLEAIAERLNLHPRTIQKVLSRLK